MVSHTPFLWLLSIKKVMLSTASSLSNFFTAELIWWGMLPGSIFQKVLHCISKIVPSASIRSPAGHMYLLTHLEEKIKGNDQKMTNTFITSVSWADRCTAAPHTIGAFIQDTNMT
jgi:hypothetical protein